MRVVRPFPSDLRPEALARGRERVRMGPAAPTDLATAMLEAHALLGAADRPAPLGSGPGWACGSVVASRCQSQAKRPT